jgi:tripartite-type tricarboxylate transporter receptor subunit TctC
LSQVYKQPVLIDNRPGVAGTLGTRLAAKSRADGYTLLLGQTGEIVLNRLLIKDLGYDPMKELKPVVLMANAPLVLLTSAQGPIKNLQDLIDLAKANPGALSFGSVGAGTPGHLAAAALTLGAKLDMVHIPYKGVGSLMTDLMAGRISIFFSSAGAAMPQLAGGKLRAIAVSTPKRMKLLPDVPSVAELGLSGFNFSLWGGMFAPADTPAPIIQSLNKEINAILDVPEIKAKLEADNMAVPRNSVREFQDILKVESEKYEKLVKEAHISAD